MATFRDFQFSHSTISDIATDTNNGNFLWIAFAQYNDTCRLQKVSANDPSQVYFTIELDVDSINRIMVLDDRLFVSVTHVVYSVYVYSVNTPLSSYSIFTTSELSLNSTLVDVTANATNIYFVSEATGSSETAQIVSFDTNGNHDETIELSYDSIVVANAISITIDSSDDMWVVTNTNPSYLYRVYFESGGWKISDTELP